MCFVVCAFLHCMGAVLGRQAPLSFGKSLRQERELSSSNL